MRSINLEPIIQSEVSQKEKDKYCILMHIEKWYLRIYLYGSNGETDIENQPMDIVGEEEGEMYGESNMEIYNTMC